MTLEELQAMRMVIQSSLYEHEEQARLHQSEAQMRRGELRLLDHQIKQLEAQTPPA